MIKVFIVELLVQKKNIYSIAWPPSPALQEKERG
jgi:hypothetical protein